MSKLALPFPNPTTYAGHSGVDFPQATGTAIRASGAGRIVQRGWLNGRAGWSVQVAYDGGPTVLYCHLPNLDAVPAVGTRVAFGSVIARVNNSGNSTGPHLHMEIMVGAGANTYAGIWNHFTRSAVMQGGLGNITTRPTVDVQRLVGAKADGIYGPETVAKVTDWQRRNGLAADGIWGPKSDAKGFPPKPAPAPAGKPAAATARPEVVLGWAWRGIQKMLKRHYGYTGAIDGIAGKGTISAFQRFLRAKGYRNVAVDGLWGGETTKGAQVWLSKRPSNPYRGAIDGIPGAGTRSSWDTAERENNAAF